MTDFMPGEPATSAAGKYFSPRKLKTLQGRTFRFRVLGAFLAFLERWTDDRKPVRVMPGQAFPEGVKWRKEADGQDEPAKMCWAGPIHNVTLGVPVQIFQYHQGVIHKQFQSYIYKLDERGNKVKGPDGANLLNEEWGDPTKYDFRLTSTGEMLETVHALAPCPHSKLPSEVADAWAKLSAEWSGPEALLLGGDPWAPFGTIAGDDRLPF